MKIRSLYFWHLSVDSKWKFDHSTFGTNSLKMLLINKNAPLSSETNHCWQFFFHLKSLNHTYIYVQYIIQIRRWFSNCAVFLYTRKILTLHPSLLFYILPNPTFPCVTEMSMCLTKSWKSVWHVGIFSCLKHVSAIASTWLVSFGRKATLISSCSAGRLGHPDQNWTKSSSWEFPWTENLVSQNNYKINILTSL